jgi:hypothetical protein
MSKFIVISEKRVSNDDVQITNTIEVQGTLNLVELNQLKQLAESRGATIGGIYDSAKDAANASEAIRIAGYIQYIPQVLAALARGTRRPFLVYLDNKPGSTLLSFPGYYALLQQDYEKIKSLFDASIVVDPKENISEVRQLIIVNDLESLLPLEISHIMFILHHPEMTEKNSYMIERKLFGYFMTWEQICKRAMRFAVLKKNPELQNNAKETLEAMAIHYGLPLDFLTELIDWYYSQLKGGLNEQIRMILPRPDPPTVIDGDGNVMFTVEFL